MHYYQFNIKDYMMATRHLSLEEDGCYRRILDQYYDSEGDLPDVQKLAKIVGAHSEMVFGILTEFFVLIDGKYFNRRADKEIEAYHAKSEGGKKGAINRWAKAKSLDSDGIPIAIPQDTQCVPNANHKPITNNQEPVTIENPLMSSSQANIDDDCSQVPKITLANGKQKPLDAAIRVLDFLNLKTGRHYRHTKANLTLIAERLKEGATEDECRIVIVRQQNKWAGTDMADYLRPATLFNRTKFAQYVGEVPND